MKRAYYLFIFLASAHLQADAARDTGRLAPSNFIFRKYTIITEQGVANFITRLDSLAATINKPENDSVLSELKEFIPATLLAENGESSLYVEVRNDSIWKYEKQKDSVIGDYSMILKNSGVLHFYDRTRSLNYRKYDLFAEDSKFEITENRTDKKLIKGYSCFKLILVKINAEDDSPLGNTIYEMYVTDQIKLPIHSVIHLSKFIPDLFPMEIKMREQGLPGMLEGYELIEFN